MQFIPESIIDQKAIEVGELSDISELIQDLKEKQPAILSFLISESFDLLTPKEKDYTLFLSLVVWKASQEVHPDQNQIDPTSIEKAEEANWEKLSDNKTKTFRNKLDIFFENNPQEDLLAFVEDALVHEEDDIVSNEGREYVFIALKTIIDCLDQLEPA